MGVVIASVAKGVEVLPHWMEVEGRICDAIDADAEGCNEQNGQREREQKWPSGEEPGFLCWALWADAEIVAQDRVQRRVDLATGLDMDCFLAFWRLIATASV